MAKKVEMDVIKRRSTLAIADLQESLQKVMECIEFVSSDLKEKGAESVLHYRAELYDAMIEVFHGVTELELLRDLRRTQKAKK